MISFSNYFHNIFLEAKQEHIKEIEPHIHDISKRPFNELFQNKGDRFLIKVYNPDFEKSAKALDLDVEKFDWKKREYDGKNINQVLKLLPASSISQIIPNAEERLEYGISAYQDIMELEDRLLNYQMNMNGKSLILMNCP